MVLVIKLLSRCLKTKNYCKKQLINKDRIRIKYHIIVKILNGYIHYI